MVTDTTRVLGATTPVFDSIVLTVPTSPDEKIDLAPYLQQLVIYEDIFSPCLTAQLTLVDSVNLFNTLPIIGNEKVTIKVYSWNYDQNENDDLNFIHRTFNIIRITDVKDNNDYTKSYTLHLASPELKKSESIKISKGFENKRLSEVAGEIMTAFYEDNLSEEELNPQGLGFPREQKVDSFKSNFYSPFFFSNNIETDYWVKKQDAEDSVELFIEKTQYQEPVISFPYMKPFDILSWLASRALRDAPGRPKGDNISTSEACNFLFFENKRGFQFVSLDTLLEGKEYTFTKFFYGNAAQNFSRDNRRIVQPERINKLQIQNCFNIIENMRRGVYASKLYSYDIATGVTREIDYDYLEEFEKTESTERSSKTPDYPMIAYNDTDLSKRYLASRHFIIHSPLSTIDNYTSNGTPRKNENKFLSGAEEYMQRRLSQLGRLSNLRMLIEVSGNSKHKVGDMVDIDIRDAIPNQNIQGFTERDNKYFSGYYLITSIKHVFTKLTYDMSIECVKDSHKNKLQ